MSIRRILEDSRYELLPANDRPEAERLSEQHRGKIDVLLTDVVLSGLGGPGLAERMRTTPQVRTIFMTGHFDVEVLGRLTNSAHRLEKPFKRQAPLGRVREVFEMRDKDFWGKQFRQQSARSVQTAPPPRVA